MDASYPENVILRRELLPNLGMFLRPMGQKRWAVLADDSVTRLYAAAVLRALGNVGLEGRCFSFPAGESSKTLETYTGLLSALAMSGFTRGDGIIALGGGMTGDLAGFVAATYLRGITLVHVPTTLLAMVDSCLGGKTGVDLPQGKNLVGAFYPAEKILIDPQVLETLPGREFASGVAEIIKYGMIAAPAILEELEHDAPDLMALIGQCLAIKADLTARDPRDEGVRRLLNFGHTYGHAYEAAGGFQKHTHGEAVAAGMAQMLRWEMARGFQAAEAYQRLLPLLTRFGLMAQLPYTAPELKPFLARDKKTAGDTTTIAVVETVGQARLTEIPTAQLWEDLL